MLLQIAEIDVTSTFEELIEDHGETTNLEVKNVLRSKNFWVTQSYVAKTIAGFLSRKPGVYSVTYEDGHKVYGLDWTQSLPSNSAPPSSISKVKKSAKKGNYMVHSPSIIDKVTGDSPIEIYNDVTRNTARYSYAKKYGAEYTSVAAKKINK